MIQHQRPARRSTHIDGAGDECAAIIAAQGIWPAVRFLNGRTRFRFTGIYRVDPPRLCNLVLFDRENPDMNLSGAVTQLEDTYCSLTYAFGPFETDDSLSDGRLVQHASRSSIISYAGVPLRLLNGHVWGTICHFDVRPRLLPHGERTVLESVAPVLVASLQRDVAHAGAFIAPSSTAPQDSVAPRT
jgi:GAF domain-containing protein